MEAPPFLLLILFVKMNFQISLRDGILSPAKFQEGVKETL
jgi:hypothetical protein